MKTLAAILHVPELYLERKAASEYSPRHSLPRRGGTTDAMFSDWKQRLHDSLDRFVPAHPDAEVRRRAFLFMAFSLQGVLFGLLFAGFYAAIGHWWGALIVLICTLAMAGAPWIVRAPSSA